MQSLARLGAEVTGIDPSHENVGVATLHSQADARLAERLQYRQGTAEALVAEGIAALHILEALGFFVDIQGVRVLLLGDSAGWSRSVQGVYAHL